MKVFNQKTITEFTKICPKDIVERACDISFALIDNCFDQLKKYVPYLHDGYEFLLVDEHLFGTSTVNSELSIFVVIKSSQLELNTMQLVNNKFEKWKIKFVNAWNSARKPKKKKRKKNVEKQQNFEINPSKKYSILDLKLDLGKLLVEKIDSESYVQFSNYSLKLVSTKNIGMKVNIYPVLKDYKSFKFYDSSKNKFLSISFENRQENFNKKFAQVGVNFVYMIRVFNNLYYALYDTIPNQIFIESLMYNVPNSLYKGNSFYETFIKVLNFLSNSSINNFCTITDETKKLSDEIMISNSISSLNKFLKEIEDKL